MMKIRFSFIFSFAYICSLTVGNTQELRSPTVKLSNGIEMPLVGFGTHFRTPIQEVDALLSALGVGYRAFDTAYSYMNEKTVGSALKKWFAQGGKREDIFITTKLPPQGMRYEDVETYLKMSLENLGLNYIDMYMIHVPFAFKRDEKMEVAYSDDGTAIIDPTTDHLAVWKAMEEQVRAGRIRSIGLSNFNETQTLNIYNHAEIKPANIEIELNLYLQQPDLVKLSKSLDIVITAYSPLGSGDIGHVRKLVSLPAPTAHPVVHEIAEKHGKTTAQVLLRYNVQRGISVIPKSGNPSRQRENLDLFNFTLTEEDMETMKGLDQGGRVRKFDFLAMYPGANKHPEYPW